MYSEQLFFGKIVHCKSLDEIEVIQSGFLAVKDGKIIKIGPMDQLNDWMGESYCDYAITTLSPTQFLMPGFVDCHMHAPQMPNIGLGMDKTLLQWLDTYTFPLEAEYKNCDFAKHVYEKVIKRTLQNGTTFANYFATNHVSSSFVLALEAQKQGQRVLVGKTSSNCCVPDYYVEDSQESLKDNVEFVEKVLALNDELVQPIITPRFAISCDDMLMKGLAEIAQKYQLNIQTHISESVDEVKYIVDKHQKTYAEVYHETGLLTDKTILAHAVHLEDSEVNLISRCKTSIAHCPASNICLSSGLCDVKRLLAAGIKVGLGTDVSGGNKSSILSAIRSALDVSHSLEFVKKQNIKGTGNVDGPISNSDYTPLNYKQVMYLATLGGAEALRKDHVIGNFVEGKEFDALLVDIDADPIDIYDLPEKFVQISECALTLLQKFLYVGDDRNIKEVFVKGRQVK